MKKIRTHVRLDKMAGTKVPTKLFSAVIYSATDKVKETETDNGTLVQLTELIDGERELYIAIPVKIGDTITGQLGVVTTPEVEYKEDGYRGIDTYTNKSGQPVRVHTLSEGAIYSVAFSKDDDYYGNGGEFAKSSQAEFTHTDGSKTTLKVIALEVAGRYTYTVFQVQ